MKMKDDLKNKFKQQKGKLFIAVSACVLLVLLTCILWKPVIFPSIGVGLAIWGYFGFPLPKANYIANEGLAMRSIVYILKNSLSGLEPSFGLLHTGRKGYQRTSKVYASPKIIAYQCTFARLPSSKAITQADCEQLRFALISNMQAQATELIYDGVQVAYFDLYAYRVVADDKNLSITVIPIVKSSVAQFATRHYDETILKLYMDDTNGEKHKGKETLYDDI